MIHTFSLIQSLDLDQLDYLIERLHFDQLERAQLFGNDRFQTVHRFLSTPHQDSGIKDFFVLRRDDDQTGCPQYFAIVEIEPLVMLLGARTVDLFKADPYNVAQLKARFQAIMEQYLPNRWFSSLDSWNCRRVDYTFNFRFDRIQDKQLFLYLTKKTSRHVRRQPKRIFRLKINDQSTAEGNDSVKIMFYDKARQIDETYNNFPLCQQLELMLDAENIVRFEVQCKKGRVLTLQRKYRFPNRNILHFLNEDIAQEILLDEYIKSVGRGNFFSLYWAKKEIDKSNFSAPKKLHLVQLLQLIAQARHVSIAKEQFIAGTRIKRTDIVVKGSDATFRNYLRDLAELGIEIYSFFQSHRTVAGYVLKKSIITIAISAFQDFFRT